jgi:hypothetical protein
MQVAKLDRLEQCPASAVTAHDDTIGTGFGRDKCSIHPPAWGLEPERGAALEQ